MVYTIITEELQDQDYLDTYTVGLEQLKDHILGVDDGIPKTPEWAEPITGVPAATIANLAREYATRRPAALIAGWGPGRTSWGEQFHRVTMVLAAMTGNIGIHGGNSPGWEMGSSYPWTLQHLPTGPNPIVDRGPKQWIPGFKAGSTTRLQYCDMWDAIIEGTAGGYPVDLKLGYILCGNHLNQMASTNRGVEALEKLEFIVIHERYMTATARFADIVLPVNTFVEREDVVGAWGGDYILYAKRCLDSLYESKSDLEICTELAPRLGIEHYNDKTDEEWLRELMAGSKDALEFDEFKNKGIHVFHHEEPYVAFKKEIDDPQDNPFPTPSGRIEIFSKRLAGLNHPQLPPIPKYIETWESRNDTLAQQYPLQIISSHMKRRAHAQFNNVPWLKDTEPQALWINPTDAQARGISDRDQVKVFNDRGTMIIPCWITERIMPGVVHLAEGGPYLPDETGIDRGGCANIFTRSGYTPGGAFAGNTALVQVEKAP
jgi:anaerobic dimethyl sulfoxide reductase subunit A